MRDATDVFAALFDVLAPPRCGGCGAAGEDLCVACADEIERNPPIFMRVAGDLATVSAAGQYRGALRAAILAFKYANRRSLAAPLAVALAKRLTFTNEIIVPVPLHPSRAWARGYNQAELLARELASDLRAERPGVAFRALVRSLATLPQSKLCGGERERNVANAFSPGPDASGIEGKSVLLVDDVITTGATLRACAVVLRRAGARRVDAACVAART